METVGSPLGVSQLLTDSSVGVGFLSSALATSQGPTRGLGAHPHEDKIATRAHFSGG